jgi:dihydrofolate synthase/folylpolyglutamate synthase
MRFSTQEQWLAWLEQLHPVSIDLGLDRVAVVWQRMGLTLSPGRVVTVAGTNGKGSSVAFLEAIYRAAGYRVCAYTSPHLEHYNERIRLDARTVEQAALCAAFDAVDRARGETSLSYFEFGTLAALYLFAGFAADLIILEVGLGGRLDAVNVIDADVALITSVDLDHQAWLGNEIDQIAREKAGIMRGHRPAVFAGEVPPKGLLQVANQIGAALLWSGRDYQIQVDRDHWSWRMGEIAHPALPLPSMRGRHQLDNAAGVLAVVQLLQTHLPVAAAAVVEGLVAAFVPGRFHQIPGDVSLIFDVAHNPHGARALAATLRELPCTGRSLALFGILADKDAEQVILPMRSLVDAWFVAGLSSVRGSDPARLQRLLYAGGATAVEVHAAMADAYRAACLQAVSGDRIVIFGSFHTVAEVMRLV